MDTLAGEATLSRMFGLPSKMESTLKGKNSNTVGVDAIFFIIQCVENLPNVPG